MADELIDRQTWIWTDSGVEPNPSDAVAVPGVQPIAEYANHWNYSVSKDIKALSEAFVDHSDTHEHGGDDVINLDGLSVGINTSPTITETDSPGGFSFTSNEQIDLHRSTSVALSNSSSAGVTGAVTVTLYEGPNAGGEELVSETRTVTVSGDETETAVFLDETDGDARGLQLQDATHYIEASVDADELSITQTTEALTSGAWTLWERSGDFEFEDHWGRTQLALDGETGSITELPYIADEATFGSGLSVDSGQVDLQSSPLYGKGVRIWNPSAEEVPQQRLGGPPADLRWYPLDGRDMRAGEGSNINAELLQGYTPEDLMDDFTGSTGLWNELTEYSQTFYDGSTDIDWDTGQIDTPYDFYRIEVYVEDHRNESTAINNQTSLSMRINNDNRSHYHFDYYNSYDNSYHSRREDNAFNGRQWDLIASTLPGRTAHHTLLVKSPQPVDNPRENYPTISSSDPGGGEEDLRILHLGQFKNDTHPVRRLSLEGDENATGRIRLYGRNI